MFTFHFSYVPTSQVRDKIHRCSCLHQWHCMPSPKQLYNVHVAVSRMILFLCSIIACIRVQTNIQTYKYAMRPPPLSVVALTRLLDPSRPLPDLSSFFITKHSLSGPKPLTIPQPVVNELLMTFRSHVQACKDIVFP